jgi:hypothetical protein
MNDIHEATLKNCTLKVVQVIVERTQFRITYALRNHNDRNAYLFNVPFDDISDEGVLQLCEEPAYTEVLSMEVVIAQKIFKVPEDLLVEKALVPCVTRVSARTSLRADIVLALPLRPRTPYFRPARERLTATPRRMGAAFELGFFVAAPEGDAMVEEVRTTGGTRLLFDSFAPEGQQVLRLPLEGVQVPVLVPQ